MSPAALARAACRAIRGSPKRSRKSWPASSPSRIGVSLLMTKFYEFFAGGGMARAGLGPDWTCLFANDFDPKKGATYVENWGVGAPKACPELIVGDVRRVRAVDLPG